MTEVTGLLGSVVRHPKYIITVKNLINTPQCMEMLVKKSPQITEDPIAMSILRTPERHQFLTDQTNMSKMHTEHPCFAEAAVLLIELTRKVLDRINTSGMLSDVIPYNEYEHHLQYADDGGESDDG